MVSWIDGLLAAFIPAVTEEGKKILSVRRRRRNKRADPALSAVSQAPSSHN
jgi:hypothetical protein